MDSWRPRREENPPPRDDGGARAENVESQDAELRLAQAAHGPDDEGKEWLEQTKKAESTRVVWDDANRKHLLDDHPERGITLLEIEEALNDPDRIDEYDNSHDSHHCLGRTEAGRWLVVAWIEMPGGSRYPVHAHQAGRRTLKRWQE